MTIERGTPAFLRTNLALFAAGLATFALLYCVQPLLPVFGQAFHISPLQSSLSLSATTCVLAFAMLAASAVSEVIGRKPVMVASLLASSLLAALSAAAPGFNGLLLMRGLMGLTLSGLPAVAMAYVAEEMHPNATGLAMGLYIGGSAIGGMTGRLLSGALADAFGWRTALAGIGLEGFCCALLLWATLPPSQHFIARKQRPIQLASACLGHLRTAKLRALFAEGFLLMGSFVAIYNYIGYRLLAPPYRLTQVQVGLIFSVYLTGIITSPVMGNLARRNGPIPVMSANIILMLAGLGLTLTANLAAIIAGIAILTAGFFGAHTVASAAVASSAPENRAQAASLYLFAYYAGSSIAGSGAGAAWTHGGWAGVCTLVAVMLLGALALLRGPGLGEQKEVLS